MTATSRWYRARREPAYWACSRVATLWTKSIVRQSPQLAPAAWPRSKPRAFFRQVAGLARVDSRGARKLAELDISLLGSGPRRLIDHLDAHRPIAPSFLLESTNP